jgi:hypothetical protein
VAFRDPPVDSNTPRSAAVDNAIFNRVCGQSIAHMVCTVCVVCGTS